VREQIVAQILGDFLILVPMLNKKILRENDLYKLDDLYPSHVQILLLLAKNKQLTMSEISKEIHVINSNLTPLVDKLIKLGYLKRQPSKKDRRVVHISLTAGGKKQVEKHKQYAVGYLTEQFEKLDDEKLKALEEHLNGINGILSDYA
jgi:DNA-binding MarR family transcriptional regulator